VTRTLRWLPLAALMAAVALTPSAAADTPPERAKQIEELEKQLREMQAKLAALKQPDAPPAADQPVAGTIPESVSKQFQWRNIGPANMGGRVTALAVVESDPATYYVATASGGLLKTVNNGTTFQVLFDNQSTVSIGDVAVAPSDPNVVWVGTGEANPRNSVSYGDGVYKSTDAGKTFTNMGLKQGFQTGKVVIHPTDPNTVYVGVLGRLYGPNPERGVFKTTDGGKTWVKSLFVDDKTGCIDLRLDPANPDVLVAAMWERKRDEYDGFFGEAPVPDAYGPIVTHGPGGGLFKSTDAGKTWKKVTGNGLPTVKTGRIGLDHSRQTKGLLFAIIDTEKVGTGEVSRVYLGVTGETADGGAKVTEVTADGPSAKAGLKAGDVVIKVGDAAVDSYEKFVAAAQAKKPGDKLAVVVKRDGKEVPLEITLGTRAGDAPTPPAGRRTTASTGPILGVTFERDSLAIATVPADGPAAKAGLKPGDRLTFVDGKKVGTQAEYRAVVQAKKAGDTVGVTARRGDADVTVEVTLAGPPAAPAGGPAAVPPSGATTLPLPGGIVPAFDRDATEVKVQSVTSGGAADKAGVKAGDVIVSIDGEEIDGFRALLTALRVGPRAGDEGRKAGDKVKLVVKQGDKTKELELALVDTPVPALQAGGPARGQSATKPYGMGLGGQQPNAQGRQGKDGFQTGGVYVSKDFGSTWERVNSLNPRPMYFSVVRVDPTDDKTLYVIADTPTPLYKSTDGGATFANLATARGVHADGHALWINPKNNKHLIVGCDGGFYASYDKGATWDHLNTLALGQFYHVAVDNKKPYRVYGGLQDNGSWGGPSHALRRYGPVNEDWVFVSGGDGFVCRVDPTDPDLVYAESQGGAMSRRNFRTGESGFIRPRRGQGEEPLRFNWNSPFILSSHNPSIFYSGAQFVFRSVKKGDDLKQISPDLTRSKKGSLTAISESPRLPGVLYAGTDDGQVWVTKDDGVSWQNVTANLLKAGVPGHRWVATLEASREKDGRCYVALDAHRSDDDKPYLFVTEDYGATWKNITSNLPAVGSTRCLREDYKNRDVLYCGTEFGAFVTANRGASWTRLGGNLPTVACHEFAQPTTAEELVVGTHGRSVWVLDVNAIRQMKPEAMAAEAVLFQPAPAVRWRVGAGGESPYSVTDRKFVGTNPYRGATIEYHLAKPAKAVTVRVIDVAGKTVRELPKPGAAAGLNRVQWDLTGGRQQTAGRRQVAGGVAAGVYKLVVTVDGKEFTAPLEVEIDPNAPKDLVATETPEVGGEEEDEPAKRIDD
jgi:S1-C subfamily serine protease/photosystem II stability/assembly factor-like uncharacterized protein